MFQNPLGNLKFQIGSKFSIKHKKYIQSFFDKPKYFGTRESWVDKRPMVGIHLIPNLGNLSSSSLM